MKFCYRCNKCLSLTTSITEETYTAKLTVEQYADSYSSKYELLLCKECMEELHEFLSIKGRGEKDDEA